nr:MAG TPA: hypothetical protein [Caudoviricetes sp.]
MSGSPLLISSEKTLIAKGRETLNRKIRQRSLQTQGGISNGKD